MTDMQFPELEIVLEFHYRLIERYGGSHGLRDQAMLESSLAAAVNRYFYEEADLAVCAATYTYHLRRRMHSLTETNGSPGPSQSCF